MRLWFTFVEYLIHDTDAAHIMIEHEISGDILIEMDVAMLKEIDLTAFGKRVHIFNAIKHLKARISTSGDIIPPTPTTIPSSPIADRLMNENASPSTNAYNSPLEGVRDFPPIFLPLLLSVHGCPI